VKSGQSGRLGGIRENLWDLLEELSERGLWRMLHILGGRVEIERPSETIQFTFVVLEEQGQEIVDIGGLVDLFAADIRPVVNTHRVEALSEGPECSGHILLRHGHFQVLDTVGDDESITSGLSDRGRANGARVHEVSSDRVRISFILEVGHDVLGGEVEG